MEKIASIFERFIERRVFVQLRDEYVGVTYPLSPVVHPPTINTMEGPKPHPLAGKVVAIPFLSGKLVAEDDTAILLETEDPNPNNRECRVEIRIRKDFLSHVTAIRREASE